MPRATISVIDIYYISALYNTIPSAGYAGFSQRISMWHRCFCSALLITGRVPALIRLRVQLAAIAYVNVCAVCE